MAKKHSGHCPDGKLSALVAAMGAGGQTNMRDLEDLLRDYPTDARLHFLQGSLLADRRDFAAACAALRRAVDLGPDYGIARFQLGLLLLGSGEPAAAQEAWGPLHCLPEAHYLHLFTKGLCCMIDDDFDTAAGLLEEGIMRNTENAPMNRDMRLVLSKLKARNGDDGGDVVSSSVGFLLQQSSFRPRH